jgi:hypothetical protein
MILLNLQHIVVDIIFKKYDSTGYLIHNVLYF